jgi:hypothetical protein
MPCLEGSTLCRLRSSDERGKRRLTGANRKSWWRGLIDANDPEETSPGRGTSRGEIRDPLLSDADRFYRGRSPFSAKSSPISIRWSLNLERTLRQRSGLAVGCPRVAQCMDWPALGDV